MQDIVKLTIPAEEKENGYPEIHLSFRRPTLEELGIVLSSIQNNDNPLKHTIKLFQTVFVEGDRWVLDDAFLMSNISEELQELLRGYPISINETWNNDRKMKEYTITIKETDDDSKNPIFKIHRPNIDQISGFYQYIESNQLIATRELLKACWLEGDITILDRNDYLLSAVAAMQNIGRRRTETIVKTWLQQE